MRTEVYKNAFGYNLTINAGYDISTANTIELNCKPRYGGSQKTITCAVATSTTCTAPVTDGFFDQLGVWDCQLIAAYASSERSGEIFEVKVLENV